MANRLLKNWTASESVDSLSQGAEIFFTRLIMVADDYGSYHSNPKLLRSAMFPLKAYTDVQVAEWLDECVTAGIVFRYMAGGKVYIRIRDFGQRLQNMRNAFPQPENTEEIPNFKKVTVSHGESPPELEENRTRREPELEHEPAFADVTVWPSFEDFWDLYDKKTGRPKCEVLWKKITQEGREQIMIHLDDYVKSTPDKKYRKNPQTYLNGKCWNDEIVNSNGHGTKRNGTDIAERARQIDALIDLRSNPKGTR